MGSKDRFVKFQLSQGRLGKTNDYGGFDTPVDLKIFNNFIYVCDMKNHRIKKLNLSGKTLGFFINLINSLNCHNLNFTIKIIVILMNLMD